MQIIYVKGFVYAQNKKNLSKIGLKLNKAGFKLSDGLSFLKKKRLHTTHIPNINDVG